jgi:nitroimidazol reductase NimA-like FMN-containing flavoprotein (pyridoxamine 5'-phosphate oxidase superfamily)
MKINKKTGTFGIDELISLNAKTHLAVLATAQDNIPYTSLVAYAFDRQERVFMFLTSKKTTKYNNILKNPNVALLIDTRDNTKKDYLSGEAFTVIGKAVAMKASKRRVMLLKTFLNKHPRLTKFSNEKSTAVIAVSIEVCFKTTKFQSSMHRPPGTLFSE